MTEAAYYVVAIVRVDPKAKCRGIWKPLSGTNGVHWDVGGESDGGENMADTRRQRTLGGGTYECCMYVSFKEWDAAIASQVQS